MNRGALQCACAIASLASCVTASADDGTFYGLLRARDLTPFGFLRLDMRPAHAVAIERGTWVIETELGYENTWALSPQVERYLTERESTGSRELGPADLQAIRDLPGENYLVDFEAAVLDIALHYKVTDHVSAYVIANAVQYGGGFLDSTIEGFHDELGFSSFGRPAVSRNDYNLIYDLKSAQHAYFERPTRGGLSHPTLGLRYTGLALSEHWRFSVEGAVKIPLAGRRLLMSTGRTDVGVQASLQRHGQRYAFYIDTAAVYYAGARDPAPQEAQVVPTLILGYEYRWTERTNLNLQGYASKSTYTRRATDLPELREDKYQLWLGLRHRLDRFLVSFAVTENEPQQHAGHRLSVRRCVHSASRHGAALREARRSAGGERIVESCVSVDLSDVPILMRLPRTILKGDFDANASVPCRWMSDGRGVLYSREAFLCDVSISDGVDHSRVRAGLVDACRAQYGSRSRAGRLRHERGATDISDYCRRTGIFHARPSVVVSVA